VLLKVRIVVRALCMCTIGNDQAQKEKWGEWFCEHLANERVSRGEFGISRQK
jgi:hypothetical protein